MSLRFFTFEENGLIARQEKVAFLTKVTRLQRKIRTQKVCQANKVYGFMILKQPDASDSKEQEPSSNSKGKGKQQSMGADGTSKSSGSASAAPKNDRKKGPDDDQNVKPPASEDTEDQVDDKKSVLFLSIDVDKNDSRACSVDVGMNDLTTMTSLRQSYNALRGSFSWTRKRAVGIKFYRVS